jgi:hypothetical protein
MLIIVDMWIWFPALFTPCIMDREAPLKAGGAGDFTRDEDHSLHQHGRTYFLNDLDILAQQVRFPRWRKEGLFSLEE